MNIHIDDILVVFKSVLLVENSFFNVWLDSCSSVIEARNLEAKDANGMLSTYLFVIAFISAYISLFYNIIWQRYASFTLTFHHFHIFFLVVKVILVKKYGMAMPFCFILPGCSPLDSRVMFEKDTKAMIIFKETQFPHEVVLFVLLCPMKSFH